MNHTAHTATHIASEVVKSVALGLLGAVTFTFGSRLANRLLDRIMPPTQPPPR